MRNTGPSLAMVMCVRDEEDFIGANLAYHHALGVNRAYIFADQCRDSTIDIAKTFEWAEVVDIPSDPARPLGLYQISCADKALKMARMEGIDWLMFIDADEFAFADNNPFEVLGRFIPPLKRFKLLSSLARGDLRTLLKNVKPMTTQIILKPNEAVPMVFKEDAPFWKLHYFHRKGLVNREVLDPLTGDKKPVPWLGHKIGKSIVRTNADVQAANSHRWTRNQKKTIPDMVSLPSEQKGFIYHFLFSNSSNWLKKYQNHACFPDRYVRGGPIDFPKSSWKAACAKMSPERAEKYYREWVAIDPNELEKYLADGSIVRGTVVEDILRKAGWSGDYK